MKKIIGLVVILAVLVLGSYYGTGVITERKVRETVSVISQYNGVDVQLKDYQRNWFDASAKLDWRVDIPERVMHTDGEAHTMPAQRYEFSMPIRVDHGPIIFSSAGVKFGLGYAQTNVKLPEKYKKQFETLFTKDSIQPKVSLNLFLNYLAKTRLSVAVPKFELNAKEGTGKLIWKGLDTSLKISSDMSVIDGDFLIKGMDFSKDKMQTTLSKVNADYYLSKSQYGLYTGSASFDFPSLIVKQEDEKVFELDNFSMNSESKISGEVINSHMNMSLRMLMVDGHKYGPGAMAMAVRNLDAEAMGRINELSMQMQNSDEQQRQHLSMTMMGQLPKLVSKGPEVEVSKFELSLPEGQVSGNLRIYLPKSASSNVMSIIQGVQGKAHLQVPRAFVHMALVDTIARKMMSDHVQQAMAAQSETGQMTLDEAKEQASNMADQRIQAMVHSGVFVVDNKNLLVDLQLENGQLTVNKKPFNPSMIKL